MWSSAVYDGWPVMPIWRREAREAEKLLHEIDSRKPWLLWSRLVEQGTNRGTGRDNKRADLVRRSCMMQVLAMWPLSWPSRLFLNCFFSWNCLVSTMMHCQHLLLRC